MKFNIILCLIAICLISAVFTRKHKARKAHRSSKLLSGIRDHIKCKVQSAMGSATNWLKTHTGGSSDATKNALKNMGCEISESWTDFTKWVSKAVTGHRRHR